MPIQLPLHSSLRMTRRDIDVFNIHPMHYTVFLGIQIGGVRILKDKPRIPPTHKSGCSLPSKLWRSGIRLVIGKQEIVGLNQTSEKHHLTSTKASIGADLEVA